MPQYAARVVGTVRDAWLSQGQAEEMEALSASLTMYAQDGWTLHSIEQVPVLPAYSGRRWGPQSWRSSNMSEVRERPGMVAEFTP